MNQIKSIDKEKNDLESKLADSSQYVNQFKSLVVN